MMEIGRSGQRKTSRSTGVGVFVIRKVWRWTGDERMLLVEKLPLVVKRALVRATGESVARSAFLEERKSNVRGTGYLGDVADWCRYCLCQLGYGDCG